MFLWAFVTAILIAPRLEAQCSWRDYAVAGSGPTRMSLGARGQTVGKLPRIVSTDRGTQIEPKSRGWAAARALCVLLRRSRENSVMVGIAVSNSVV